MRNTMLCLVVAILALTSCTQANHSNEDAKAMLQSQVTTIWNNGNVAMIDDSYTADFVRHNPASWTPATVTGIDEMREYVTNVRETYKDFTVEIHDVVMEGTLTALRWTVTGTHQETGTSLNLDGISMVRTVDGKSAEEWVAWDTKGALDQAQANADAETSMK